MAKQSPQSILLDAATLLEQRGWCQLSWQRRTGECCLEGALGMAATGDPQLLMGDNPTIPYNLALAIASLMQELGVRPSSSALFLWNDDKERTAADVVNALRRAAAR